MKHYLLPICVAFLFVACGKDDTQTEPPEPLTVNISMADSVVIQNDTVSLTAQSSGGPSSEYLWAWNFEKGKPESSSEQNPSVVFADTGTFDIRLKVTSDTEEQEAVRTLRVMLDSATYCASNPLECARTVDTTAVIEDRIDIPAKQNFYEINVEKAGVLIVRIEKISSNMDLKLSFRSSIDPNNANEHKVQSSNGILYYEELMQEGTYYLIVESVTSSKISEEDYQLTIDYDYSDVNEWNGSFETATEINLDEIVRGQIRTAGDQDFFKFTLTEVGTLHAQVRNVSSSVRMVMRVYDHNRKEKISILNDNNGTINLNRLLNEGTYYIMLEDSQVQKKSDTTTYYLNLSQEITDVHEINNSAETATPLTLGTEIEGAINVRDIEGKEDIDYYKFSIEQDGVVDINVINRNKEGVLRAELQYASTEKEVENVTPMAGNYARDGGALNFAHLLKKGDYLLKLTGNSGNRDEIEQPYRLNVTLDTDDMYEWNNTLETAAPIELNKEITAYLRTIKDVDYFTFTLEQKTTLDFVLTDIPNELSNFSAELIKEGSADKLATLYSFRREVEVELEAGKYYFRFTKSDSRNPKLPYKFIIKSAL